MKITKAVITAAGNGTRFLPATKNIPKELLPIINVPTIHYVVEQLVNAGITDIIIITRHGNTAIEDYFDTSPALEHYLLDNGKVEEAAQIKKIYTSANFVFVRQKGDLPYGNAAPLYSAKELLKDAPFIYTFGDVIIFGKDTGFSELISAYEQTPADIMLNCLEFPPEKIIGKRANVQLKPGTNIVEKILEKPSVEELNGNLASIPQYLLTPRLFDFLTPVKDSRTGEFIIQAAFERLIEAGGIVRANMSKGEYMTVGDPFNYLKSTIKIALTRNDLREQFVDFLHEQLNSLST